MPPAAPQSDPILQSIAAHRQLEMYLQKNGQVRFADQLNSDFAKTLVVSSFSYIEAQFMAMLTAWINDSAKTENLRCFVTQHLARGFFSYFDFKENKSRGFNRFLAMIGTSAQQILLWCPQWNMYAEAFIILGYKRNNLVHKNYAEQNLGETTVEDIEQLYKNSLQAMEIVAIFLRANGQPSLVSSLHY